MWAPTSRAAGYAIVFGIVTMTSLASATEPKPANPWLTSCLGPVAWEGPSSLFAGCAQQAVTEHRFGDVIVLFVPEEERVAVAATKGLGKKYEQCVREALAKRSCLLRPPKDVESWPWHRLYDVQLGVVTPVLPDVDDLVRRWDEVAKASWFLTRWSARRALREVVPRDVEVTSDGCLWHPSTASLGQVDRSWLARSGREVRGLWRDLLSRWAGAGGRRDQWFWLKGDRLLSVDARPLVGSDAPIRLADQLDHEIGGRGTRLCMRALDAAAQRQLRGLMTEVGSGWVGDVGEILTDPHVSLPGDRLYQAVALTNTNICGVDKSGGLMCVGRQPVPAGWSGAFVQVAAGDDRVCGRRSDGSVICRPSALAETTSRGPFTSISTRGDHACGIRVDRSLACWAADGALEPVPAGQYDALSPDGGRCALRNDRRIVCWEPNPGHVEAYQRVYEGPFAHVDGSGRKGCGVTDSGAALCWSSWGEPKPLAGSRRFRELSVMMIDSWCGLTTDDTVVCADERPESTRIVGRGRYHGLVCDGNHGACALDDSGHVSCWGPLWP